MFSHALEIGRICSAFLTVLVRAFSLCSILLPRAHAVLFVSTDDAAHNTTPPTAELADSGWQWQGNSRGFGGTPIAPYLFLTARHVGGQVGDVFVLGDQRYLATARHLDPDSDLAIWQVSSVFPSFAPLFQGSDEPGQECVIFGHGLGRGSAVEVQGVLKGWRWGGSSGTLRWGRNVVVEVVEQAEGPDLLALAFDESGLPDEASWTGGDSGSGLFLREAGEWRLAGVAFAVDGPFRLEAEGGSFSAALLDQGGLWRPDDDEGWEFVRPSPRSQPARSYATRVSSRVAWVRGIIEEWGDVPGPPLVECAEDPGGAWRLEPAAIVDTERREVRIPVVEGRRFFRLRHAEALHLRQVAVTGEELLFSYDPPAAAGADSRRNPGDLERNPL